MADSSQRDSKEAVNSSSLDILSVNFDPLKALSTSEENVSLPCPEVQPLDNLAQYEALVKGTVSKRALVARREQRSSEGTERSREETAPSAPLSVVEDADASTGRKAAKQVRTVVDFMKEPHLKPFLFLKECVKERARVQVWTRHIAGLRGVTEGTLVLFDHHFNVVLQDAWEVYIPFKPQGGQRKRPKRKRRNRKRGLSTDGAAGVPHAASTTTGQVLGLSKQLTAQCPQEYPSVVEDISSDCVTDEENSTKEEQVHNSAGTPQRFDLHIEAITSSSDSEHKAKADKSETEEEDFTDMSSCRMTEHHLSEHTGTVSHTQSTASIGQSGEELCAPQRYPPECHGLLKLFAAHSQCGRGTAPPLWQHSAQVFIRGDNVILVARRGSSA